MSFEFSRRSFLKYSAVAAVAVAGAGLFTGCDTTDSYNPITKGAGAMTLLQVTAAMGTYDEKNKKYTAPVIKDTKTIAFPMKITNGRGNPIYVNPNNFKVTVLDAKSNPIGKYTSANGLTLEPTLYETNLKKDASVSGKITVTLSQELAKSQSIILTYCPDLQYNEYSMNWQLTLD